MNLSINPKIFTDFDNPRIAVVVVRGANNRVDMTTFRPRLTQLYAQLRADYTAKPLSELPKIAAWRNAYRTFGVKAKDYPSSIEALLKRAVKGEDIGTINPLVDIYNYVSLTHLLPAGGEDLAAMQGDLYLTYAAADEVPVTVLGRSEQQAPAPGEVIYKDAVGTICRRWNWREVARTIITGDTQDCILVLEALNPVTDDELRRAQHELGELVQACCEGRVSYFLLDHANPGATIQ